jgi:dsRNA-specific ribonuclease
MIANRKHLCGHLKTSVEAYSFPFKEERSLHKERINNIGTNVLMVMIVKVFMHDMMYHGHNYKKKKKKKRFMIFAWFIIRIIYAFYYQVKEYDVSKASQKLFKQTLAYLPLAILFNYV